MTVFDTSLESAPITEASLDPILPDGERFILELVGFERSGPDQFRKNGGVKWTFAVYDMDGHPFEFKDEPYELWRTTDIDRNGKPLFNIKTQAHAWASALLGRTLTETDNFSVSELRNKKMSALVVWRDKRPPATGKTFDLASLRHVPVAAVSSPTRPAPGQVSADPSDEDIDRALSVSKIQKSLARLLKLDADSGAKAQAAVEKFDLDTAPLDALTALSDRISVAITKALDE